MGSEMCIRDRYFPPSTSHKSPARAFLFSHNVACTYSRIFLAMLHERVHEFMFTNFCANPCAKMLTNARFPVIMHTYVAMAHQHARNMR